MERKFELVGQENASQLLPPNYVPVSARVLDVAGSPRVACRTHGESGGNALKEARRGVSLPTSRVQKGVKQPQFHTYSLDLELPSTPDTLFAWWEYGDSGILQPIFHTIVFEPKIPSPASAGFLRLAFTGQ